ncbi:LexA family transcriptional regulator [Streptococcus sp. 32226D021BW]
MFSGERLRTIRLANEITQENLGKLVGVGKVTISKWESETTVPNAKHLRALEETFLVEMGYFDADFDLLSVYHKLTSAHQGKVIRYSRRLLEEQRQSLQFVAYQVRTNILLSAGPGEAFEDEFETETVYFDSEMDHDVATWIKGNSMEPMFQSGEVALIKETGFDYDGGIYAIVWFGHTYIKRVYREEEGFRLVSINPDHPDKFAFYEDQPKIVGKVVGNFMPLAV